MDQQYPINVTLNTEQFALKWAEILTDRLHNALDKYNIGKLDGPLWMSIHAAVIAAGGDAEKVITRFLQYGRFIDMGVGRGVPIGLAGTGAFSAARNDDGTLRRNRRRKKVWYSKTYYADVMRFKELYLQIFNQQVPGQITEALAGDISMSI
ncbi:hypothetical protein J3L18_05260 [Mucilaginibacter gossypii]|uniref:hypothetical protein n=1 Tax=Mucilaginibacter gossypii TaxID=551996 RepID=UPI000DCE8E9F|nr:MULTISPECIES: hypothetical protein [Mucilaginibacter]QTE38486.1 hypothetical protein J3L18_05260 [Mucilaginibacter gossypii]RAV59672.1 hypothetical protein DIU36_04330 [Mucilaginibacter rubeus]